MMGADVVLAKRHPSAKIRMAYCKSNVRAEASIDILGPTDYFSTVQKGLELCCLRKVRCRILSPNVYNQVEPMGPVAEASSHPV